MISTNPLEDLPLNKVELFNSLPKEFKRKAVKTSFEQHNVKGGSVNRFLGNKSLFIRLDNLGIIKRKFFSGKPGKGGVICFISLTISELCYL